MRSYFGRVAGVRGFTVIELLVVITVVTVLLSLLVPAISKSRDTANAVLCKSNLRQIHIAITTYNVENPTQPCYVVPNTPTSTDARWMGLIAPYLGLMPEQSAWQGNYYHVASVTSKDCVWRRAPFICPNNAAPATNYLWDPSGSNYWVSYSANAGVSWQLYNQTGKWFSAWRQRPGYYGDVESFDKAPISNGPAYALLFEACYAGRGADSNPGFWVTGMLGRLENYKLHRERNNYVTISGVVGDLNTEPDRVNFMYAYNSPMY
jgi:prepilin-type N-terminal cleavage/methylation domain-containing protein